IPPRGLGRRVAYGVALLDRGEVHIKAEIPLDRLGVAPPSVGADLRAAEHARAEVGHEGVGILGRALADLVRDEELRGGIDRREDVLIAGLGPVRAPHALLLLADEGPYLVALDERRMDVPDQR